MMKFRFLTTKNGSKYARKLSMTSIVPVCKLPANNWETRLLKIQELIHPRKVENPLIILLLQVTDTSDVKL